MFSWLACTPNIFKCWPKGILRTEVEFRWKVNSRVKKVIPRIQPVTCFHGVNKTCAFMVWYFKAIRLVGFFLQKAKLFSFESLIQFQMVNSEQIQGFRVKITVLHFEELLANYCCKKVYTVLGEITTSFLADN